MVWKLSDVDVCSPCWGMGHLFDFWFHMIPIFSFVRYFLTEINLGPCHNLNFENLSKLIWKQLIPIQVSSILITILLGCLAWHKRGYIHTWLHSHAKEKTEPLVGLEKQPSPSIRTPMTPQYPTHMYPSLVTVLNTELVERNIESQPADNTQTVEIE